MCNDVSSQNGKALFLPFPDSLDSLRRKTVQALLTGAALSQYTVFHEDDYFPGVLDSILCDPGQTKKLLKELGDSIVGSTDGAYRCVALWDWGRDRGILIHKESKRVLCAFLPAVSEAQARLEKQLSLELSILAQRAEDTVIDLGRKPPKGIQKLADVLTTLSAKIDPEQNLT